VFRIDLRSSLVLDLLEVCRVKTQLRLQEPSGRPLSEVLLDYDLRVARVDRREAWLRVPGEEEASPGVAELFEAASERLGSFRPFCGFMRSGPGASSCGMPFITT